MNIHGLHWTSIESLEPHGISWNTMKFIVFAYLSLIDRSLFVAIRGYSWLFRGYFVGINGPWLFFVAISAIRGYLVAISWLIVAISWLL